MVSRSTFHVSGFRELEKTLKAMGPQIATKAGNEGLRKATNQLRDIVRANAPKGDQPTKRTWRNKDGSQGRADYGRLRQNIKTRKQRSKKAHTLRFLLTTTNAFWGRFSEFGTENEPARPWFKPALDQAAGQVSQTIATELRKAIDRAARKARK